MPSLLNVRAEVLGAKLRRARTLRRMTQGSAAEKLGMARTTLVAIEAGKRPVSVEELRQFAETYDIPESELLDESDANLELNIEFRSSAGEPQSDAEAHVATLLYRLASATLRIESVVGQASPALDLPVVRLPKAGGLDHFAEDCAGNLRSRLGIGLGPIESLPALLEFNSGIRVFERPLPSKMAGAVAFDEKAGAFILLNSLEPTYRRRVTCAHETGHLLLREKGVAVHFNDAAPKGRLEKFCDLFGVAFLAPASTVRRKAQELHAQFGAFSVRQLMMMAVFFNISIEAMTRRMENLNLLSVGTYESLKAQGIGLEHRRTVAQELSVSEDAKPFTPRTLLLASVAYERDLLSEQQIASMLDMNLIDVRAAMQVKDGEDGELVLELLE
jgi:Zn-dependent peptidase ImmA (M78 family)/transcriptional regulator with XRE-family HTH domain